MPETAPALGARSALGTPLAAGGASFACEREGVAIGELAGFAMFDLRGAAAVVGEPVSQVFGFAPPLAPNTAAGTAGESFVPVPAALWLGPDQWLLLLACEGAGAAASLRAALDGRPAMLTDVSDARALFRIEGRHARDLLAKGFTVDVHERALAPGGCVQGMLARVRGLVWRVGGPADRPRFVVGCDRSVAVYLRDWLLDAARWFG